MLRPVRSVLVTHDPWQADLQLLVRALLANGCWSSWPYVFNVIVRSTKRTGRGFDFNRNDIRRAIADVVAAEGERRGNRARGPDTWSMRLRSPLSEWDTRDADVAAAVERLNTKPWLETRRRMLSYVGGKPVPPDDQEDYKAWRIENALSVACGEVERERDAAQMLAAERRTAALVSEVPDGAARTFVVEVCQVNDEYDVTVPELSLLTRVAFADQLIFTVRHTISRHLGVEPLAVAIELRIFCGAVLADAREGDVLPPSALEDGVPLSRAGADLRAGQLIACRPHTTVALAWQGECPRPYLDRHTALLGQPARRAAAL